MKGILDGEFYTYDYLRGIKSIKIHKDLVKMPVKEHIEELTHLYGQYLSEKEATSFFGPRIEKIKKQIDDHEQVLLLEHDYTYSEIEEKIMEYSKQFLVKDLSHDEMTLNEEQKNHLEKLRDKVAKETGLEMLIDETSGFLFAIDPKEGDEAKIAKISEDYFRKHSNDPEVKMFKIERVKEDIDKEDRDIDIADDLE